jgi:Tol biopolymer transport system component
MSNRAGQYEVFVMPRAGGEAQNISQDEGMDNYPAWTPKGDLTWVSERDGGFEIYTLPAAELKRRER